MKNRYSKYKSSGVEWIGEIPEHWNMFRVKYVSKVRGSNVDKHIHDTERQVLLCNYTDVYYNEKIDDNIEFSKGSCSNEEYEKFKIKKGDVVLTKDSESPDDIGVPSYVSQDFDNVVCGYHLSIITPDLSKIIGNYLFRQVQSERVKRYFEVNSNGITRFGLGKSIIENLEIIVPPLPEQEQIVKYLDEKTNEIDNLTSITEKKIELLKEKRTSTINQIITKGVDPNVELKNSGIECIGEIPKHWKIKKLKYSVKFDSGFSFSSTDYSDEGVLLIRIGNLYENNLNLERSPVYLPIGFVETHKQFVVLRNDILISLTGTLGKRDYGYSIVYDKEYPSLLNQRVGRIRLVNDDLDFTLLTYILHSESYLNQLFVKPTGTKQGNLSGDDILSNYIIHPPKGEQEKMVRYLNNKNTEIDNLISIEQQRIETLKEYRQSLISEVITGKVRVCKESKT